MMGGGFSHTESMVASFYDEKDALYRSFWSEDGELHWGLFTNPDSSFPEASRAETDLLINEAKIDPTSFVLDVGCGNGTVSNYIARKFQCRVLGIDISNVRIQNAIDNAESGTQFLLSSATDIAAPDDSFTHVIAQATLCHMPKREDAFSEIYRVCKKGGWFLFDDLLNPDGANDPDFERYYLRRMNVQYSVSFDTYKDNLPALGFKVVSAYDLSEHLLLSYEHLRRSVLAHEAEAKDLSERESYQQLGVAYERTVSFIRRGILGLGAFICTKIEK